METSTAETLEAKIRRMTPVAAPPDQRKAIQAFSQALETLAQRPKRRAPPKCMLVGPAGEKTPIPESIFYMLERVAEVLARGDALTVVPVSKEVTTQQAAEILNVSRQYLVRLVEQGRIAHRKTGKHRRLRVVDVLAYKEQRDNDRRAGLRELSQTTQEFGGYDAELK